MLRVPLMFSTEYLTLVATAGSMIGLETFRYWRHRKNLKGVPIRIHVNGTRGKSSVTRLITAGLQSGGFKVFAKTTGTLPRVILPDGKEYPVFRLGEANIIEQQRMVAMAAHNEADAVVVECMALQPHLQSLSQEKLIAATHGVITNARPDHLDVMGPTEKDVALALAGTVPVRGKLYTGLGPYQEIFEQASVERESLYMPVTPKEAEAITKEELSKFSYIEHAENVALALKVCEDLGVAKEKALKAMQEASADPGAMVDYKINFFGRQFHFINGFAANDPSSTEKVWRISIEKFKEIPNRIAIFNCRADRPERSLQLGYAFVGWPQPHYVILMGTGTYIFARAAAKAGFDPVRLIFADDRSVELIFEKIVDVAGPKALLVGMGNIGGMGLELVRFFKNRAVLP